MKPQTPLPYSPDSFPSPDAYVEALLHFITTTTTFQRLVGGIHLLDFFTLSEGSLFERSLPPEWQPYILSLDPMSFIDLLMRHDLDSLPLGMEKPPKSLESYIRDVRRLLLRREVMPRHVERDVKSQKGSTKLPRAVSVGMKPKKIHEVSRFAEYVDRLAADVQGTYGQELTHLVDFGSGKNYLGRTLALPPYNRHVVAVEGRETNITASRDLDVQAGLSNREKVRRNKKVWQRVVANRRATAAMAVAAAGEQSPLNAGPEAEAEAEARARAEAKEEGIGDDEVDLRPSKQLAQEYSRDPGKGMVSYVVGRLESGDLSDVMHRVEQQEKDAAAAAATLAELDSSPTPETPSLGLMAISIHSCGNLSHYGIKSLIMNPAIKAVAIVGCCYNLMTEKLGPPTYKFPGMRPTLQAVNGRVLAESSRFDPQGFPISDHMSTYGGDGVRFNITARMMACQAPYNWGVEESSDFFKRNLFRALLQRIMLDKGVIRKVYHDKDQNGTGGEDQSSPGEDGENDSPLKVSTSPLIVGCLRKKCFASFKLYVRGVLAKLASSAEHPCDAVSVKMGDITDEELEWYEARYMPRAREVSALWTLMAFSACVVESVITTDRWLFLREQEDVVQDCWVEAVFDYKESPRNLVVVGIKK